MDWLLLPLAFVIWSAVPIGATIAKTVLDEVRPNRQRFARIRDTIVTLAIGASVSALAGWIIALITIISCGVLITVAPQRAPYTVLSALGLGLAIASADRIILGSVAVLILVANVLVGALAQERHTPIIPTIAQPIGAILIAILSSLFT